MKRYVTVFLLSLLFIARGWSQEDPALAAQIVGWTELAKSELKSQEKVMALETAGLIWTEEEWKKTADIQRLYNDYLDSFRDIVVYAAQLYGFYQEVERLVRNFDALGKAIDANPDGLIAGALSAKRNDIYRELLTNGLDIINDVRLICMSEVKMTEKERVEMVFGIRPKLARMNRQVIRLIRVVKYSSYTDILVEIELIERKKTDKAAITRACMARWRNRGGMR